MVGDEILVSLNHPRQVTDAQLLAVTQSQRDRHTAWIAKRLGPRRGLLGRGEINPLHTQPLGTRQVETEQIAAINGHSNILTPVDLL